MSPARLCRYVAVVSAYLKIAGRMLIIRTANYFLGSKTRNIYIAIFTSIFVLSRISSSTILARVHFCDGRVRTVFVQLAANRPIVQLNRTN
jgi:hypothetical protein